MDYNLNYLIDIKDDNDNFETKKIIRLIDMKISNFKSNIIFHIVPIIYSIAFISGSCVYIYKIFA